MEIYLKKISTTVTLEQEQIFWGDYEVLITGTLQTCQRFGAEMTSEYWNNQLSCG